MDNLKHLSSGSQIDGREAHHTPTTTQPALQPPFLGKIIEVCIVSPDVYRTMDSLVALGIGPFKVYSFTSETVANQTWKGQPSSFSLKVCFAQQGDLTWEIMQPVAGPSIMANFLEQKGEGIHHVAFDCGGKPVAERVREFERRGFPCVQSGTWIGKRGTCEFRFFDTHAAPASCFETIEFSEDWEDPDEMEIYPAPA